MTIGIAGYLVYSRDQKEVAYTSAEGDIYYTDGTLKLVEGASYRNYRFSLEGEDECQIEFKLTDLPEDAHEMEYIIFTEPDNTELSFTEEGWEKIYRTEDIYADRLLFSSSKGHPDDLKYVEGKQFSLEEDVSFDGLSLYKYKDPSYLFPEAESGEKVYFFIGNPYENTGYYNTRYFSTIRTIIRQKSE